MYVELDLSSAPTLHDCKNNENCNTDQHGCFDEGENLQDIVG